MTMIIPADHQQAVRRPRFNLPDQRRIDDTVEMFQPRPARRVFHKLIFISLQHWDIPTDMLAEAGVIDVPQRSLLPGIKDPDPDVPLSEPYYPRYVILDRMCGNNSQLLIHYGSIGVNGSNFSLRSLPS